MVPVLTRARPQRRGPRAPFDPLALPGLLLYTFVPGSGSGPGLTTPNANPATLSGTTVPVASVDSPGFGFGGSLEFAAPGATSYLRLSGIAWTGMTRAGRGKAGQGPARAIRWRQKFLGPVASGTSRNALVRTDGFGLFFVGNASNLPLLNWFASANVTSTAACPVGTWFDLCLNFCGWGQLQIYLDGTLVLTANDPNAHNTIDFLGSSTNAARSSGSRACDFELYPRELTPAEVLAKAAGTAPRIRPTMALRMDNASGGVVPDTAQVYGLEPAVTSLADLTGLGNHHTLPGGSSGPVYVTTSPPPVNGIQTLGQTGALRFAHTGTRLTRAGLLGAAETVLSGSFAGMVWDYPRVTTYGGHFWIWGASNNGTFGTAAADQWMALGFRMSGPGTFAEARFELALKGASAAPVRLYGGLSHGLPVNLGFRYQGGTAAELWQDGVMVSRVTASIPASLNLSGDSEFSPLAAPAGWQHVACALGRALW